MLSDIAEIKKKPEAAYQIISTHTDEAYKYFKYIARPKFIGTISLN